MFNIFRNPFIDAQVGYLLDSMIDARRKETEEYWRGIFEKELDVEYWRGYNDAMVEMSKNKDQSGGME